MKIPRIVKKCIKQIQCVIQQKCYSETWRKLDFFNNTEASLRQIFRKEGRKVVHSYVERKYQLKQEQLAEALMIFSASLQRLLLSAR